jgi:CBS domain-containing protein
MLVKDIMTADVRSCRPHDSLQFAAGLMWEADCGCVPVVDDERRVVGIITDRDICMAAFTQNMPLWQSRVESAMARKVACVGADDSPVLAEEAMQRLQVRRLPVVDRAGTLVGLLSLADLAYAMESAVTFGADGMTWTALGRTLAALSRPRVKRAAERTPEATAETLPPSSGLVAPVDPLGATAEAF